MSIHRDRTMRRVGIAFAISLLVIAGVIAIGTIDIMMKHEYQRARAVR